MSYSVIRQRKINGARRIKQQKTGMAVEIGYFLWSVKCEYEIVRIILDVTEIDHE